MASGDLHVHPRADGGWEIRREGFHALDRTRFSSKDIAWGRARQDAQHSRVDAILHGEDDLVEASAAYRGVRPRHSSANWVLIGSALLVAITFTIVVALTASPDEDDAGNPETVAQGLAIIDEVGFVPSDDPVVADYQVALDALRPYPCLITEERIADMAIAAQRELHRAGISYDIKTILVGTAETRVPRRYRSTDAQTTCAGAFTAFVVGQS